MWIQARAILWAQWRTLWNYYAKGNRATLALTVLFSIAWYGLAAFGALACGIASSDASRMELLEKAGPGVLVFMLVFWQVIPILMTSTGASLELRRLVTYPVSPGQLFALEVMLRVSTGIEMLIVLAGVTIGLAFNPAVSWWGPLAFVPWVAMNLCFAAGLRGLLGRLLARRRVREIAMIALVMVAALPQLLLMNGLPDRAASITRYLPGGWWPWELTARLALGKFDWLTALAAAAWTAATACFGWWQFTRGLRFDAEAARATTRTATPGAGWIERIYRLPSLLLPDPAGALVEKEIRFLSRAPRFRLVFLMGFSFGLLVWLPLAFGGGRQESFFATNYLAFVTVYALLLLGEVSFWNTFGFDRSAIQNYYVMPVRFSTVLAAKNLASLIFVLLEISAVAAVCALLRMPVTPAKLAESYSVALVLTLYLMSVGNLGSVYFPRPSDPAQSWRNASAGRFQAMLLFIYPVCAIPIALAYLARYAFASQAMFYAVLGVGAAIGAIIYWVAMESAVSGALDRREQIVTALSQGEGPVAV